jgi:acetyl esterase/lipase
MTEQQRAALDATLRQVPLDLTDDPAALRSGFEEMMRHIPVAGDIRKTGIAVGGVDAIEVAVDGIGSANVILYFHGGVYVFGSADSSVPLAADLARRTGAKVVSVDYRLAPESPYPAAVEDARSAYEGLLSQGVDPGNIAVAGESAGGGLAVAALLALRDAGVPMPSSAFVMSPWADLTLSGRTITGKQESTRPLPARACGGARATTWQVPVRATRTSAPYSVTYADCPPCWSRSAPTRSSSATQFASPDGPRRRM